MNRLKSLSALAVSMTVVLSGCGDSSSGSTDAKGDSDSLEVFSWWTSGSEDAALGQLTSAYTSAYPDTKIVNGAVAGGGGGSAQQVLQTRIQGGTPPDTWQVHLGPSLTQYTDASALADLTSVYDDTDFRDVMPAALLESLTVDGKLYAVPTGAHRGNVLWYSVPVLEEAGVTLPEDGYTPDQFIADLAKVDAAGGIGLCLGGKDAFAPAELFENTLLGVVGPDGWASLISGETPWDDAQVTKAADYYTKMMKYVDPEASALTWDQAAKKLAAGECAFNSMGDWAYGEMVKAGAAEATDFGYVPQPGSDGSFLAVVDAFVVGANSVNPKAGLDFLKIVGDPKVQLAFNKDKGSIPVRTDVDVSSLPQYQQAASASWNTDELPSTIVHGAAMPPDFVQALFEAVTQLSQSNDVDAFASALAAAAG